MNTRTCKQRVINTCLAVSAVAMLSVNAAADTENNGWYLGGGMASANAELDWSATTSKETKLGHLLYAGYNFNDFFGIEVMGFVTGDLSDDRIGISDAYLTGLALTPKLTMELSPTVALFAKAGIASMYYSEEVRVARRGSSAGYYNARDTHSWSEVVVTAGFGAEFSLTENLKLRLAYDYFDGSLNYDDDDYYYDYGYRVSDDYYRYDNTDFGGYGDVDTILGMASLSVNYHF